MTSLLMGPRSLPKFCQNGNESTFRQHLATHFHVTSFSDGENESHPPKSHIFIYLVIKFSPKSHNFIYLHHPIHIVTLHTRRDDRETTRRRVRACWRWERKSR